MEPPGRNGDKIRSSIGKSAAEFDDTQRVKYDSQHSPSSGEDSIYPGPGDEILETQQIDTDCEAEAVNPWEETQVVADSEDEMEFDYYDGLCCGKTQLISECSQEGDFSDRTEVLSDSDTEGTADVNLNHPSNDGDLGSQRIEITSLGQEEPGFKLVKSPPLVNGTYSAGSCRRDFTSVRATSLRASGLAARYKTTLKGFHDVDCCGMDGDQPCEQREGTTEMKKSKVSSSISRRLFTENLDSHENERQRDNDNFAGLSCLNSDKPGESSQNGALNYIDELLKATVFEYDQDTKNGNLGGSNKLDLAFSGKGAQTLAKKVHIWRSLAEPGAYDFNDRLEDEGGGEFFVRMKDVFFGSNSRVQKSCPEPRKPKRRTIVKRRALENEEHQIKNVHGRQKGLAHSEHNLSKTTRKINQGAIGFNLRRRYLNNSMEEEAATAEKILSDCGIGLGTHTAAEIMSNGANNCDVGHRHEGDCENNIVETTAGSSATKHHCSLKRSCLSDSRLAKRVNRFERPSDQYVEASKFSVAARTRSKKDAIIIVETKDDEQEKNITRISGPSGLNKMEVPHRLQNTGDGERGDGNPTGNLDDNGSVPAKELHTGDEQNGSAPVAWRNSKGKVITPVCVSHYTSDKVRKSKGLSNVDFEGKKGSENGVSNRTEGLLSSTVDIFGQTVKGRQSTRTIRSSDLAKYAKLYARLAVSSIKPEENDQFSSPYGKTTKTKLQSIGYLGEDDQCSPPSGITTKTNRPSIGSPMKMMTNRSDVAVTTPLVNCKTPTESVSPVCAGDEYYKQSCIQNSAAPSLVKELNQLNPILPRYKLSDKGTRKRRDMAEVRVIFSHHLDQKIVRRLKKVLARLGVPVVSSILEATHFVADEFVRTRNMLEAIAGGKPVVTHLWLENCGLASCYLDENNYLLRDKIKEKEIGFSMPVSLAHARQQPLMKGKRVLITPNTKPGLETLSSLVKAVHGKAIERICRSILKGSKIPDDLIILSCEEDYATCLPLLQKGVAIHSSELLLNGIVVQRLEFSRYRLFEDKVKRTRSTTWIKKADNKFVPTREN